MPAETHIALKFKPNDAMAIRNALRRAADWSDLYDNGPANGERWMRNEKAFVNQCHRLANRLQRALDKHR